MTWLHMARTKHWHRTFCQLMDRELRRRAADLAFGKVSTCGRRAGRGGGLTNQKKGGRDAAGAP